MSRENIVDRVEGDQVLDLIDRLCKELTSTDINYCHWKSNYAIDRSASGENDLDLLISQADYQQFTEILYKLGFKEFFPSIGIDVPGIRNFLGYDIPSDTFVHVHAHSRLVIGHDFSKNYHIPIEDEYLRSAVSGNLFRIPAPEFELIIFVIRMMIKHFMWDTIINRQGRLYKNEKVELAYLLDQSSMPEVYRILDKHLPIFNEKLFDDCLRILQSKCSLWFKVNTSQVLYHQLKAYVRIPFLMDAGLKLWHQFIYGLQFRLLKRRFHWKTTNGGFMLAIIGGDKAGKTTALDGLYQWLSPRFAIVRFHMGKPHWSCSTTLIRAILKITTIFGITQFVDTSNPDTPISNMSELSRYAHALRTLCTAQDRYTTYTKARRCAFNGHIILCDRFPVPQFISMDGPRINQIFTNHPSNWFVLRIIKKEEELYKQILLPEILVVFRLDPEIAISRNLDESSDFVYTRSSLVWQTNWDETTTIVIDASKSKDEVLVELKTLVWSRI